MITNKKLISFILDPPLWLCGAVWGTGAALGSAALALWVAGAGGAWATAVYAAAIAGFVLSVFCVCAAIGLPRRAKGSTRIKALLSDERARSFFAAFISALSDGGYVVFGIIIACVERSVWVGVLVGYHLFLMAARYVVLRQKDSGQDARELRAYSHCGFLLVLLAYAFVPVIKLTLSDRHAYTYFVSAVVYVTAIAVYTLFKLGSAIYSLDRAHRKRDVSLIAVRNVDLADALISLFTLQALMLSELGAHSSDVSRIMNPLLGGAVVAGILVLGLKMQVTGIRRLRERKVKNVGPNR